MRALVVAVIGVCLTIDASPAQDFSGTYTATTTAGVTLTLTQSAQGDVTGTLASAEASFTAHGIIEDGTVRGTMTGGGGGVYFAAELFGDQLQLTLFEPGPDNQPNYDTGQTTLSGDLLRDGQAYGRFFNQAGQAMLETQTGTIALGQ